MQHNNATATREKDHYIYLIFSKTGTWLSRLITVYTGIKYTHASLSLSDTFTTMYSFGRLNPDNPFSGGFVEENIFDGVFKKSPQCECLIYRIKITEEQLNSLQAQLNEFIKCKDTFRYNFTGLIGVALNRPIKRKHHYFCSQFVSQLLINSNICHCVHTPEMITPEYLQASLVNKELVYEGRVSCLA